jgi:gluconate 2-dehydrogenase gamma chain
MMKRYSDDERREVDETPTPALSRRTFLKGAGVAVTGVVGASVAGCGAAEAPHTLPGAVERRVPMAQQYPSVPYPPPSPPAPGVLQVFTPHEAQVVEALTARLLPGTPDDPGAREAGVVYYIDNMLAYQDGLPEPVYRQHPFAESYTEDEPPESEFQVIWVPEEEIDRYGYQSVLTPRDVFRIGIAAVDRYAQQTFDQPFLALSEEQQDEIITALLDNEATGFEPLTPESFFHALRRYTCEGMFSDPAYGGNRDMVGWRLIGYPGAQRAYTSTEIQLEGSGLTREVWSMADLPHFHAGEPIGPNVVLPVSGSVEEHDHR